MADSTQLCLVKFPYHSPNVAEILSPYVAIIGLAALGNYTNPCTRIVVHSLVCMKIKWFFCMPKIHTLKLVDTNNSTVVHEQKT